MSLNKVKFSYPGLMPVESPKEKSVVYVNDDGSARLLVKAQPVADAEPVVKTFIQHAGDATKDYHAYELNSYVLQVQAVIDLDSSQWLNNPDWVDGFEWNDTLYWKDTDTEVVYNGTTLKLEDLPAEGEASNNFFLSFPEGFFNPGTSVLDITVGGDTRRLIVNRTTYRNTQ